MILSLEILQAYKGDCLLLHYGSPDSPQIIVIDAGPSGIYKKYLKPRLLNIKDQLYPDESLPISMVMVSHADDDHVNGIVRLTNDLVQEQSEARELSFKIDKFWFNSFDDIIGNIEIPVITDISTDAETASMQIAANPILDQADEHISAVIASTGQGRTIRDNAGLLDLSINSPFTVLPGSSARLVRGDSANSKVNLGADVSIHVIHPNEQRLIELQKKWDEDLAKAKEKGDDSIILASMASSDKSPFNLSSIVGLIEYQDKKILLTGDGRGDDIYEGLKNNNLLDEEGKLHVDILKIPHHGSDANITEEFLQKITAKHYVISADGKHHNPDQKVLDMFERSVKSGTLHLTNHEGEENLKEKLDSFIDRLDQTGSNLIVSFPDAQTDSRTINLLEDLPY